MRQYFGASSDSRYFVRLLDNILADVDVIITSNEKEALILENELIKRHQPRFNVELKDDKSFLHIRIDTRVPWPRIQIVRRPRRDGAQYFGPFHSASKLRATVKLIERHFGLRTCDDLAFKNRSRPCIQCQIKRCPGPCVLRSIPMIMLVRSRMFLFLKRKKRRTHTPCYQKMSQAAKDMNYEAAARYRDQIKAIGGSLESQRIVQLNEIDQVSSAYTEKVPIFN